MAIIKDLDKGGFDTPLTQTDLEHLLSGQIDFKVKMVPAGMARKQRIRAMEKTAADKGLTDATRRQAWNEAGKLKAVEKQAARNRHKLINGPGGLAETAKIVSREVEKWQKRGGRDD